MEITQEEQRRVGLVEDVTQSTLERLRIERERDYDLLTGLYSRRAFYQRAEQLFREPERLGQAALVMLDLDNLKRTNDRFGHDWGDQYIRQAGQCFASAVPKDALCARLWRYGSSKEPAWLVQSLCGGNFDPRYFTDYLTEKYTALYRL